MPIPDYQSVMLPLLTVLCDKQDHQFNETMSTLGEHFRLTEDELKQPLPSGSQPLFKNRIGWARTYLKKAGSVESPKRGYMRITERGLDVLAESPAKVDVKYLERFEEFRQFRQLRKVKVTPDPPDDGNGDTATPEEALETAYESLREELAARIVGEYQVEPASAV